ncbi:MAG: 5'-3' exonuclease H3TH domain-containing protein [Myxococcota bacterium]|nr:5'-3' exonuclease H3TH domain-containing protein [Myxococcota bacterium]
MKIHLIDGTYELFRAFYGAPPANDPSGRPVGGARGLLRSLISLLDEPETSHVAIAFDHVIESFRNELFSGYKTGEGMDPDLFSQFQLAEEVAHALGLVVWPMIEFEADDALATAATRFSSVDKVDQIVLASPDKDLAQCVVGRRVVMLDRMRHREIDENGVQEKWGVSPESIPDLLALMGDSADGIPGIRRWGAKSCATVLQAYGHIDQIPDDPDSWTCRVRGAAGLARNLSESRDSAELYRRLATLRTDVPLKEDLEDLVWRGARHEALTELCNRLGDSRPLDRISQWRED